MDGYENGRLARRLGTSDAVVIGLGAMIGAGVFAAPGPAAQTAGAGLLLGLGVAGAVAACNASSSARLAIRYPEAGGTYVYGRERLGPLWGYLAGWGFVWGKTASCAAMALTFGVYATPGHATESGVAAVVALATVNSLGIRKTAWVTRALVALTLAALAAIVVGAFFGGQAETTNLSPLLEAGPYGILQAGGLLFFAFAGYARLATLGEEVLDPRRTIPRAVTIALAVTIGVYALVLTSALLAAGPDALGGAEAPLTAAVAEGRLAAIAPVVRAGATVASLGVLVSLLAGVGRTTFAMARRRDLPAWLDAVHPRHGVPHRAEVMVAVVVVGIVLAADVRGAIGFSSFLVLVYYAITNAAALTLRPGRMHWVAVAGVVGCLTLAFTLPAASVLAGLGIGAAGLTIWLVRRV